MSLTAIRPHDAPPADEPEVVYTPVVSIAWCFAFVALISGWAVFHHPTQTFSALLGLGGMILEWPSWFLDNRVARRIDRWWESRLPIRRARKRRVAGRAESGVMTLFHAAEWAFAAGSVLVIVGLVPALLTGRTWAVVGVGVALIAMAFLVVALLYVPACLLALYKGSLLERPVEFYGCERAATAIQEWSYRSDFGRSLMVIGFLATIFLPS